MTVRAAASEERVLHVRFWRERRRELATMTRIYRRGGETFVEKRALHEEARLHLEGIARNAERLREAWPAVRVPARRPGEERDRLSLVFDFVEGTSLEHLLDAAVARHDRAEVRALLDRWLSLLELRQEPVSALARAPFGPWPEFVDRRVVPSGNLDPGPSNLILDAEAAAWAVDGEWCLGGPVPAAFVLSRCATNLLGRYGPSLLALESEEAVLRRLGLVPRDVEAAARLEALFQSWVFGGGGEELPHEARRAQRPLTDVLNAYRTLPAPLREVRIRVEDVRARVAPEGAGGDEPWAPLVAGFARSLDEVIQSLDFADALLGRRSEPAAAVPPGATLASALRDVAARLARAEEEAARVPGLVNELREARDTAERLAAEHDRDAAEIRALREESAAVREALDARLRSVERAREEVEIERGRLARTNEGLAGALEKAIDEAALESARNVVLTEELAAARGEGARLAAEAADGSRERERLEAARAAAERLALDNAAERDAERARRSALEHALAASCEERARLAAQEAALAEELRKVHASRLWRAGHVYWRLGRKLGLIR